MVSSDIGISVIAFGVLSSHSVIGGMRAAVSKYYWGSTGAIQRPIGGVPTVIGVAGKQIGIQLTPQARLFD